MAKLTEKGTRLVIEDDDLLVLYTETLNDDGYANGGANVNLLADELRELMRGSVPKRLMDAVFHTFAAHVRRDEDE